MSGERDLARLLASLKPQLHTQHYVYVALGGQYGDFAEYQPLAMVREDEGMTLVVPQAVADQQQLIYHAVFACLSLTVHSSLEAVGLTAAVATALAEHGISANLLAGFYHDHILLPAARAEQALHVLEELAQQHALTAP